jgi:hypothetical protein
MPVCNRRGYEWAMTEEGVGEVILGRGKRTPAFTEKKFRRKNIFCRLLFFLDGSICFK